VVKSITQAARRARPSGKPRPRLPRLRRQSFAARTSSASHRLRRRRARRWPRTGC